MPKIQTYQYKTTNFGVNFIIDYFITFINSIMLNDKDLIMIAEKGISKEMIELQLKRFEAGFPYLRINSVATIGNGIMSISPSEEYKFIKKWQKYQQSGGSIEKMVPASGAASRMFKDLFAFINSGKSQPTTDFEKDFFDGIKDFAFFLLLNKTCINLYGKDIDSLIADNRYVDIVKALLNKEGLNYGALPKGMLKFHRTTGGSVHTPIEEHLEEGAQYAYNNNREINIHFTVSPEHRNEFEKLLQRVIPKYEQVWGVKYNVSLSEQKSSTDTIAVNSDNTPYRNADGSLLFRPAGHGALIENLNERTADVVFIKNIDNVVPAQRRHATTRYKKVIGGILVDTIEVLKKYLAKLNNACTHDELTAMLKFLETTLSTYNPKTSDMNDVELSQYLISKFNRPVRVCGMVRNEGEPGGGPYLAYNEDGSYSPQILEAAQIDATDPDAVTLMNSGTHFNPVDLVCYIKDVEGNKFDLRQFVDQNTGLISEKSKDGVVIKALELPGLWNGSMSDWNTIFVEVPAETFNPVKTVNDLLRPVHNTK